MKKFRLTKTEKISIVIMILIITGLFISSSMTYSQQKFSPSAINHKFGLVETIIKDWNVYYGGVWHNRVSDHSLAEFTQFMIRKLAHFTSFFFLGLFSFLSFKRLFRFSWMAPFFIWFYTIFWAVFDEFHQFLTGDRTPSVHDVVLDSSGSLLAIVICFVIYLIIKNKIKKENQV